MHASEMAQGRVLLDNIVILMRYGVPHKLHAETIDFIKKSPQGGICY